MARRKQKRGNKIPSIKKHFKRRMWGRFQLDINDDDINEIIEMVQTQNTIIIEKQSRTKTIHQIQFRGKTINIVYDRERKLPITAMYDDQLYDEMVYHRSH